MKLTKNYKIIIGVGLAGAGLWWYMNKGKKGSEGAVTPSPEDKDTLDTATTPSVDTGTKEPTTREEKENYVIENTTSSTVEDSTGFDGDRFQFDPTVGYEMPVGKVKSTNEGDTFDINMPSDDAFDVMSSADGEFNSEYDDLDDYDDGYDIFYGIDDEPTDNPVAEAKAIVQSLDDAELGKAVQVVKTIKSDPSKIQSEVLSTLVANESLKEKISRLLNDVKVLKKQPDWKAMYEQEKAKAKMGKGYLKRKWNKISKGLGRQQLSKESCEVLFSKWAKNKRMTQGGKASFLARCEKKKARIIQRGVGKVKWGRGRNNQQVAHRVAHRVDRKPEGWVGRPHSGGAISTTGVIRKARQNRVGSLNRFRSVSQSDIRNCLRHPHQCQKKASGDVKQVVRTFVSSRPRLARLFRRRR